MWWRIGVRALVVMAGMARCSAAWCGGGEQKNESLDAAKTALMPITEVPAKAADLDPRLFDAAPFRPLAYRCSAAADARCPRLTEAEQPAFERAVKERCLGRLAQPQLARQLAIRREDERVPAGEALLQCIAKRLEKFAIRRFFLSPMEALVVAASSAWRGLLGFRPRRVAAAHFDPLAAWADLATRMPASDDGAVIPRASTCLSGIDGKPARWKFARALSSMSPEISLPNICRSARELRAACLASSKAAFSACQVFARNCRSPKPEAAFRARRYIQRHSCAASARKVPLPHIGSYNGVPAVQPVAGYPPRDLAQRRGALVEAPAAPKSGSPEVSR